MTLKQYVKNKINKTIVHPADLILDSNLLTVTTTIGDFIIKKMQDNLFRMVTFTTSGYYDEWMENALYAILYKYNDIKNKSMLNLKSSRSDSNGNYFQLADGSHLLNYRNYSITLTIKTNNYISPNGGVSRVISKTYTIATLALGDEFVTDFEKDMIKHRNELLRINSDSTTVNVYKDSHESDGYTFWEKMSSVRKRPLNTIYLDSETKHTIVNTVNQFFANKEYYRKHGISHNLKILLYGIPGGGKDSIARMIASEWYRNIYYVTGGRNGRFIPDALTSYPIQSPLFLISDIDKYPFLINEHVPEQDKVSKVEGSTALTTPVATTAITNITGEEDLAFAHMLNALDGLMSGEDRIIIMTTNHIERFSPTFFRPGRIDLKLEIKSVNEEVFRKFVYDFYEKVLPNDIKLKSNTITVGELQTDVIFVKMPVEEFIKKYIK